MPEVVWTQINSSAAASERSCRSLRPDGTLLDVEEPEDDESMSDAAALESSRADEELGSAAGEGTGLERKANASTGNLWCAGDDW